MQKDSMIWFFVGRSWRCDTTAQKNMPILLYWLAAPKFLHDIHGYYNWQSHHKDRNLPNFKYAIKSKSQPEVCVKRESLWNTSETRHTLSRNARDMVQEVWDSPKNSSLKMTPSELGRRVQDVHRIPEWHVAWFSSHDFWNAGRIYGSMAHGN